MDSQDIINEFMQKYAEYIEMAPIESHVNLIQSALTYEIIRLREENTYYKRRIEYTYEKVATNG